MQRPFETGISMDDIKIGEILEPGTAEEQSRQESRVRDRFWATVKKAARSIPFMEDVVASYFCALDANTPMRVKGVLLAALAYFVLPFDLVPDFLVGIGFTDDVAVLMAAITAVKGSVTDGHRLAARKALADYGEPEEAVQEKPVIDA
jgi:uncharacterized membrane protein YkvA (DUF1232 family)